jgi:hypothetical protein
MFSIRLCRSRKEERLFERLPERLHGLDPAFIPPFPGSIVKYLSPKSAFNRLSGEIYPFLAWRDGKPVGRIAAIINHAHNERYRDKTGFFGFFDCEDNLELARALFEAAGAILRARNRECLRGPYNPSINDECGLLVEGFKYPPYLGLVWNPKYHKALIEQLEFQPVCRSYGLHLPLHRLDLPERLKRIVERVARRRNIKLRPIDMSCLEEELKIVREIYNATLDRNWGFIPISMDDLLASAEDMKAFADPEMIVIAEINGENAGVALTLPNFNEILAHIKKTPHLLRLPHILWLMKTRRINSARQAVLGISPRFRDRGLHAWLLCEQFVCGKQRYANGTIGWVEESNTEILENSLMLGAIRQQEWRIYEKPLGRELACADIRKVAA